MTDSLREQSAATAQDTLWSETAEKAEQLRLLYHLDGPTLAPEHLVAWLASGSRSKLRPFVKLARTIRRHRLSNGRLDGLNPRVRLISHRSFGRHSAAPLIVLVYLSCGALVVTPPLR